jgi:hypothetical protein
VRFEPVEKILERIMKLYNENPRNWRVLIDRKGNALILGPETGYKLRIIHINPQEYTGVGVEIQGVEELQENLTQSPSYGFRPLTQDKNKTFLEAITHQDQRNETRIRELFKTNPVPTHKLQGKIDTILSGPIITHPDLSLISKRQKKLEARLILEAEKGFQLKYPSRARIYE